MLDAFEHALAIALPLHVGADGQRRHLGSSGFGVGVERRAGENHAVVLDHRVVADVALNLGAAAFDQRAVFLKRRNQLQYAAHVVFTRLAQLFEFFVYDHGADTVVHVHLQQDRAVHRKRNDVAALHAFLAGLHAVLQIKAHVGRQLGRRNLGQQLFGDGQGQFGVNQVVV